MFKQKRWIFKRFLEETKQLWFQSSENNYRVIQTAITFVQTFIRFVCVYFKNIVQDCESSVICAYLVVSPCLKSSKYFSGGHETSDITGSICSSTGSPKVSRCLVSGGSTASIPHFLLRSKICFQIKIICHVKIKLWIIR